MTQPSAETPVADAMWSTLEQRLAGPGKAPLRVLIGTDGSGPAEDALRFIAALPLAPGTAIRVVTALEGASWLAPASLLSSEQAAAAATGEHARGLLAREGFTIDCAIPTGPAANEILKAAEAFHADLIVVGSHGRTGLRGFLVGSVARNVAKHADRSVLVARAPLHGLLRAIIAVDESRHAPDVLAMAALLPLPEQTELVVCHVTRPYVAYAPATIGYSPELDVMVAQVNEEHVNRGTALLERVQERMAASGRKVTAILRRGDPASEIITLAREQEADLIIAGARGVSPIEGLVLGSVADRLLNAAPCSLLLAHPTNKPV